MRYPTLFVLLAIICFSGHRSQAQTPQLAIRYFEAAQKKMDEGDWLAAVEKFTKAIATNARLKGVKSTKKSVQPFDESRSDSTEISVSDPFTAHAYVNRGAAWFYRAEFDQAVADYERAIRINPRLAQAYLGRGAARNAQGDRDGAMRDYDRALKSMRVSMKRTTTAAPCDTTWGILMVRCWILIARLQSTPNARRPTFIAVMSFSKKRALRQGLLISTARLS
jgi:tetratricopeptide (TPR) repeat protein